MSTLSANSDASPKSSAPDHGDRLIAAHLEAVRGAIWRSLLMGAVLRLIAGILIFLLVFAVIDQWIWSLSPLWRILFGLTLITMAVAWIYKQIIPLIRQRISREYAAFSIEADAPELQHSLTSYVTLRDDRDAPGIRGIVVRSIGSRAARFLTNTGMAMPTETSGSFRWAMIVIALLALVSLYAIVSPKNTLQSVQRLAKPLAAIEAPTRTQIADVTPGDTEAVFGQSLQISARIRGASRDQPAVVEIVSNRGSQRFPMSQATSLAPAETEVPGEWVTENFSYHVLAGDARQGPYQVTIRDLPAVVIDQVTYSPPAYTRLPRRSSNSGAIEGVEGTSVSITATSNRKISKGRIEFNPRDVRGQISATAGNAPLEISEDGQTLQASWNLQSTIRGGSQAEIDSYRIHVWDETGNENVDPIIYPIRVATDLPPEVRIAVPERSPKEIPLNAQQMIEVRSVDPDYGLTSVELQIRRGTSIVKTITLLSDEGGRRGNHVAVYRFRPDTLGLRSGDKVTVEAIARDNRYDVIAQRVAANRTVSDPVEFKILPPPPSPPTPDGDGLQAKDDQPTTTTQNGEEGQGDQGQTSGGDATTDQAQQGEGTGGGGKGSGASNSDNPGQQDQGQGTGGKASNNNDDPNGNGEEPSSPAGHSNNPNRDSDSGDSDPANTAKSSSDDNRSGSSDSPADSSPTDGLGTDPPSRNDAVPEDQRDPPQTGEQDSASASQEEISREAESDSTMPPQQPPAAPASSDGEAFERIRDYLNQQAKKNPSSATNSHSQPSDSDQSTPDQNNPNQESNPPGDPGVDKPNSRDGATSNPPARDGGLQTPNANDRPLNDPNSGRSPKDNLDPTASAPNDTDDNGANSGQGEQAPGSQTAPDRDSQSGEDQSGEEPSAPETDSSSEPKNADAAGSQEEGQSTSSSPPDSAAKADATQEGNAKSRESDGAGQEDIEKDSAGQERTGDEGTGDEGASTEDGSKEVAGQESEGSQPTSDLQIDKPSIGKPGSQENSGGASSGQESPTNSDRSESADGENSPASETGGGSSSNDGSNSSSASNETTRNSSNPSPSGDPTGGSSGSNFGPGQLGKDSAPPPDPMDLEAAKKATDLVLDALRNQREKPDQELLDQLGWTPQQFRRFIDRWQAMREIGQRDDPASRQQFSEALESLGLQPVDTAVSRRKLESREDRLGEIRDTGARMQPPPQFRDAIEAFRRGVNK